MSTASPTPQAPQQPMSGFERGCMALIALPVLAMVILLIMGALSMGKSSPENDRANAEARAMQQCRAGVRAQLKDPRSADFSNERVTGQYVRGTVRATNSFGGVVPTRFTCDMSGNVLSLDS